MLPQRTFSPRTFMGDRGILLDSLGRVLRSDGLEEKIVAPKPWKACRSPVLPRGPTWSEESLFSEAGQEIQGILLNGLISGSSSPSSSSDERDDDTLEMHIPVFSTSPCAFSTPITPPSRSHNPMVQDSSFSHDNDGLPEGAELGLLSVSPPSKGIYGTF